MGAIKDIVDLCRDLRDEGENRKVAEAISKIQSLTLDLQSEQATLVEKNTELLTENHQLKLSMEALKQSHAQAMAQIQEKHRAEMAAITASNARPKEDELDDVCKQMLIALANHDPHDGITDDELIQHFGLQKAKGDYHFAQLRERQLVGSGGGQMGRGAFWFVTDAGLKYLAARGLLDTKPAKPIPPRPPSRSAGFGRRAF